MNVSGLPRKEKKKNPQNFLVRAEGTQAQSGAMPALSAGSLWALGAPG